MFTEFTFGVISYNSQQTIIETLESIKYQIINYGKSYSFYLVVSDDCSTDDTIKKTKEWARVNGGLFKGIKILQSNINRGVVENYCRAIVNIHTDDYRLLAGDDLICSQNILEKYQLLPRNEIWVCLPFHFRGEHLIFDEKNIAAHYYFMKKKHTGRKDIKLIGTLSPYASVEMMWKRYLYSEECLKFIKNYKNFEDDPSLYFFLSNNKGIHFKYIDSSLILHRLSDAALSSGVPSVHQLQFLDDLHNFHKYMFKNERNVAFIIIRGMILWDTFLMKHRFGIDKTLGRKYVKYYQKKFVKELHRDPTYIDIIEHIKKIIKREDEYLLEIKERATDFLSTVDYSD